METWTIKIYLVDWFISWEFEVTYTLPKNWSDLLIVISSRENQKNQLSEMGQRGRTFMAIYLYLDRPIADDPQKTSGWQYCSIVWLKKSYRTGLVYGKIYRKFMEKKP